MNKIKLTEIFKTEGYSVRIFTDKKAIEEGLGIKEEYDFLFLFNNLALIKASATICYAFHKKDIITNLISISYYNKHINRPELGITHVIDHADNNNLIEHLISHAKSLTKSLISLAESNKK